MRRQKRSWFLSVGLIVLLGLPLRLEAATYYLGPFTGSTPLDDADCGTGTGTHPSPHPCASLAYWTQNRRASVLAGCSAVSPCMVRLAPGPNQCTLPVGTTTQAVSGCYTVASINANHCILAQSNVTYEGRLPDDSGVPADFNSVIIDGSKAGGATCTAGANVGQPCEHYTQCPGGQCSTSNPAPCLARTITPLNSRNTYPDTTVSILTNFTLRYLTLANAQSDGSDYHGTNALYGDTGSSNILVDHVRFTGNRATGLMLGEVNWRQNQCSISKSYCGEACVGATNGSACSTPPGGTACSNGGGTCTQALDWDCQVTGRRTTNATVQFSQFDHNAADAGVGASGGLQIGCVDTFHVLKNSAFQNKNWSVTSCCLCRANTDCPTGETCFGAPPGVGTCGVVQPAGCSLQSGFWVSGGIHGTIDALDAYDNGQAEIEVGSSFNYYSHDNLYERLYVHNSCALGQSGLKLVGEWNSTVRNSFVTGNYRYSMESYNCPYANTLANNTIWNNEVGAYAVSLRDNTFNYTFKNNIFRSSFNSSGVLNFGRIGIKDPGTVWDHNVIVQGNGTNYAWEIHPSVATCTCTALTAAADCGGTCVGADCCIAGVCRNGGTLSGGAHPTNACQTNTDCNTGRTCLTADGPCAPLHTYGVFALNDWNPSLPAGTVACGSNACLATTGLTTFQGASNGWFGGNQGTGDKWGTAPLVVNASSPSAANLHLASTDLIARDAGVTIPGLTTDYDGQARPFGSAYDIGADEYSTAAVGLVGDLDGSGVVDILDLQRMVNVLLGLETDQAVIVRADLDGVGGPTILDLQRLVNILLGF